MNKKQELVSHVFCKTALQHVVSHANKLRFFNGPEPIRFPEKPFLFGNNPPVVHDHIVYNHIQLYHQLSSFFHLNNLMIGKVFTSMQNLFDDIWFYHYTGITDSYCSGYLYPHNKTDYDKLAHDLTKLSNLLDMLYYFAKWHKLHTLLCNIQQTIQRMIAGCKLIEDTPTYYEKYMSKEEWEVVFVTPFQITPDHPAHIDVKAFISAWFMDGFIHGLKMDWDQYHEFTGYHRLRPLDLKNLKKSNSK